MDKRHLRFAVGALFFLQGICFASWASRIPLIQNRLGLSDSLLGVVLFSLPIGLMVSLPLSGMLISRLGSRRLVLFGQVSYFLILICLGFCTNIWQLCCCLFFFGLAGNMVNISVNTQAIAVEYLYERSIMASFHGLWSLAGFSGAAIGSLFIAGGISTGVHFLSVGVFSMLVLGFCYRFTVRKDHNVKKSTGFRMPDRALLHLGMITLCGLICEGAMFDWSGIYFRKVVQPDPQWLGAGYAAVMFTMAGGRFVADSFSQRFGLKRTLQLSGLLICIGLALAVALPSLLPAVGGFMLVGFGISSVVPLVYSAAGRSKTLSPGVALATVSTIGFFGFMSGPPLIGLISGAFSLRTAFGVISFVGILVTVLSSFIKRSENS